MESERETARAEGHATTNGEPRTGDALGAIGNIDTSEVASMVAGFAKEHPHVALAAAAGVGFLLGGGLTPRIVGAVALFAGRRYIGQAVRDAVDGAIRAQIAG